MDERVKEFVNATGANVFWYSPQDWDAFVQEGIKLNHYGDESKRPDFAPSAGYNILTDSIHVLDGVPADIPIDDLVERAVLHELIHWTAARIGRDIDHPIEEMIARLGSNQLADALGLKVQTPEKRYAIEMDYVITVQEAIPVFNTGVIRLAHLLANRRATEAVAYLQRLVAKQPQHQEKPAFPAPRARSASLSF